MRLELQRVQYLPQCVKGHLYRDGTFQCFTLEPPEMFYGQLNVPNKTCTPEGTYTIVRNASVRFRRVVPVLVNVPGRSNIEMHPLNLPSQTEGCIGVGQEWFDGPLIGQSDLAFDELMRWLYMPWISAEVVTITITRDPEASNV